MVFRKISRDLKDRALWLIDTGWAPDDVCQILGVSLASTKRWRRNYRLHNSVIPPPNPNRGRPSPYDATLRRDIHMLIKEAPDLYIDEVMQWATIARDVKLSWQSTRRIIRDAGLTYKQLTRAAAERDEEQRQKWREQIQAHLAAEMVVTVDESSKDGRTLCRVYGRAPKGQRAYVSEPFSRGERFSMVAALTTEGYAAVRVVPGSVNGEEFFDFIVEDVVSTFNTCIPWNNIHSISVVASEDAAIPAGPKRAHP